MHKITQRLSNRVAFFSVGCQTWESARAPQSTGLFMICSSLVPFPLSICKLIFGNSSRVHIPGCFQIMSSNSFLYPHSLTGPRQSLPKMKNAKLLPSVLYTHLPHSFSKVERFWESRTVPCIRYITEPMLMFM